MDLTRSVVEREANEYESAQPLYAVEQEHVDLLPGTFRSGQYGWRDAEWVVQWYFRRLLGAYPDPERRATESAYGDNDYEAVRDALAAAVDADDTAARLAALTELEGVDVPVASAFCFFLYPDRYVVVGEREWRVLRAADELDEPYPDTVDVDDYQTFDAACRELCDRLGVDAWTLYRALWNLGAD
jgi:hypothetical protein